MSSIIVDPKQETVVVEPSEANGLQSPSLEARSSPQFQEGLGSHPLWQEYLAELEANRQADIAESNRQADLELEKTNPLARIAGSYATDPNWAEFLQAMETSRRELDETAD